MTSEISQTPPPADPQQIIQILTTEHYNLQSGRSSTITDTNGRAMLFLSTVSSGLVAMAFIGQMSQMGAAFFTFALILFPSLLFLGLVTFVRLLEMGIEDAVYARGIARIRHYYTEVAPQIKPYLILPTNDDMQSALSGNMGIFLPRIQIFLTGAGMISVINGVLGGVFVALLLIVTLAPSAPIIVGTGVIVLIVLIAAQTMLQSHTWRAASSTLKPLFPAEGQGAEASK